MNTAMRWEPFRTVDELFNTFSPFFGRMPFTPGVAGNEPEIGWMPVTDILVGE